MRTFEEAIILHRIAGGAVKFPFGLLSVCIGCVGLIAPSLVEAQSPVLDVSASSVALQFWTKLKVGDGREGELVADKATFGMMGLGGAYDHEIMTQLASHCQLVGMFGGNPKDPSDPTAYVWAILECNENGKVETLPLGFGIQDNKVTQLQVDMFSQISIDRSMIEGK